MQTHTGRRDFDCREIFLSCGGKTLREVAGESKLGLVP
jgi:hypothetical protein